VYSTELLKHFENQKYAGDLPAANCRARIENPVCGDILELTACIENGVIRAIRFRAKGCVPSMACASAVCHLATERSREAASQLTRDELSKEVGGVPQASTHALQLALDALHQLLDCSA
jgi:nitrogen fixation protein NifU and related proteins